jgi:hypothetical protein
MNSRHKNAICAVCLSLTVAIASFSLGVAQIPQTILYQGILTDSLGAAVPDGTYFIRFVIWSDAISSEPAFEKWNGNIQAIEVVGGLIESELGASPMPPLPPNLFDTDTSFYLGMTVGSGSELLPRIKFAAVPYSYKALIADTSKFALGVAANSITGAQILDASVGLSKLSQDGAQSGNVIVWNGTQWTPASQQTGIGDITSINVGSGISGGGDSGDVAIYILPDALTSLHLAPNSVGSSELQSNSVGTTHILPGAITSSDLAVSAIGTSEVADNSVRAIDLFDEPGIAQGKNVNTVSLDDQSMTSLCSLTITIPNSGFIYLSGRVNLRFYGATNSSLALVQIDTAAGGTQLAGQYTTVGFSTYPSSGDYNFNCTSQRTYFKTVGTYTFRLEGRRIISVPQSQVEASSAILTAVYFPTSYGGVQTVEEDVIVPAGTE